MKIKNLLFFLVCCSLPLNAQQRTVHQLDEVVVSDTRLAHYAEGHKLTELRDSTVQRNGISLTSLLGFNSNLYFKENGLGMVSSPSFRGTNASHTTVVWNGININSQLNGQVDFNTINPFNYSNIIIRSGGGSVQYGTGAIGGTIHLNNELYFKEHAEHQVFMGYGSFNSQSINYKASLGKQKWSTNFGINYNRSDNDYKYLETDERNTNGEFEHLNLNFNTGYFFGGKHLVRLYHQTFIADRNLSGNLFAPGRSRYEDQQYRTQLEWTNYGTKMVSKLKVAHLREGFKYYENKDADFFSEGVATTLLARYALDFELSNAFRLNTFVQYNHLKGKGSSFGNPSRNDFSVTAIAKHTVNKRFRYNLSLRQDFSSDYDNPVVFAFGSSFDVSAQYGLMLNASRNFRIPTFNDLYWQPGGNLNLLPEYSQQIDLGHVFRFGHMTMNVNTYLIETKDMIRWLPTESGIWSPINVDKVRGYGAELELAYDKEIGSNHHIDFKANYAYTISEDKATQEQLIYVPEHSANASVAYTFRDFGLFYQHLYNGEVPIIAGELKGYNVANMGIWYSLKIPNTLKCRIGVTVNNLYNTYYENVALRPMPNRNIQSNLLLNF